MSLFDLDTQHVLGATDPEALVAARKQLHQAVQIPGAVGNSLVPEEADDTHTTLQWSDAYKALVTRDHPDGFRIGLTFDEPALIAVNSDGVVSRFELDGNTLEDAWTWVVGAVEEAGGPANVDIEARDYGIESHPVNDGAEFDLSGEACDELGRWYQAIWRHLKPFAATEDHASIVRCWPHHFDVAVLVSLDPGEDIEEARSVNVGMSPGDGGHETPYLYVVPWPSPVDASELDLPGLPRGNWATDGWFGAVYSSADIVAVSEAQQQDAIAEFLASAYDSSLDILETS